MRHFEYVGGSSEKFWEIERDGTTVTVRFGRIGTSGQTQVKDLGEDDAATAHVAKLVAEKVKKGYVEAGATPSSPASSTRSATPKGPPKPPAPPAPATARNGKVAAPAKAAEPPAASGHPLAPAPEPDVDEDHWEVPPAWCRQVVPIRGRGPTPPATVDKAAPQKVAELVAPIQDAILRVVEHSQSDPEIERSTRLHLGAPTGMLRRSRQEANPLGAAGVAAVVIGSLDWGKRDRAVSIADDWVVSSGLGFAAEAGALLVGLTVRDPAAGSYHGPPIALLRTAPHDTAFWQHQMIVKRLRCLIAAADDDAYAEVVRRLAAHRHGPLAPRLATSYLVPSEQHWVDEDILMLQAAGVVSWSLHTLVSTATTREQATGILDICGGTVAGSPELVYSMAAHIGTDVAPILAGQFDGYGDADSKKRIVSLLAQLPTDEAFAILLDRLDQKYVQPAAIEASGRWPRRAARLLAEAAAGSGSKANIAKTLLRDHVLSRPAIVERVRSQVSSAAAQVLEGMTATRNLPVAPAARLPELLRTPPWTVRRARPKPIVVTALGAPSPTRLAWKPGEQQRWATIDSGFGWLGLKNPGPGDLEKAIRAKQWYVIPLLAESSVEVARPYLATYTSEYTYNAGPALQRILGRLGDEANEFVLRTVLSQPSTLAGVLLPLEGTALATKMAAWYVGSKSIRRVALAWFERHAASAAVDLLPFAIGPAGKERATAEAAIRMLVQLGHEEAVRAAAAASGPAAVEATEAMLAADPLQVLPAKMPTLPGWVNPALLPQVVLADRSSALPPEAVGHLCTMFAISRPGETYAGIDVVRDVVDPTSLSAMAWGLFERWRSADYPPKESWILGAQGLVGDDETVRRLAPLVGAWPGESAHARAVAALDVLSAIGSDVALLHLHRIAEKAKFKGLKTKAQAKIEEVAEGLGLTSEQLADRLVPDFGLEPDGSLLLDYGTRRFRVGFDEQLKPMVADEGGARRKVLPKPGANDDQQLAPAAYAMFTGLKKDVKTIAADQIRRFERAMVVGRRWSAAEQRTLFVEHPLLWHLARRLVWATFDEHGRPVASFRVAEDRTLADSSDDEISIPEDSVVGIAHPLHLPDALPAWSDLFADYEILQPFPQLGREVLCLTEAERIERVLARYAGVKVPTGKVLGLAHRGWERGTPQDAGIQAIVYKPIAAGLTVGINLDPGIIAGDAMEWPEQTLSGVWLTRGDPDGYGTAGDLAFGALDPISASEALRDLEALRA